MTQSVVTIDGLTKLANDLLIQNTALRNRLDAAETQRDELLKQLEKYEVAFEGHEDLLEQLYWEFDADRKKHPEDERIQFKNKLRFFAGLVNQYANQLKAAYADKSKALEKQRDELLEVLENWINALDEPSAWMECRDNAKKAIAKAKGE